MDKLQLLKKLLPGFLPIIVFIVIDEAFGTMYGLIAAIGIGIIELIISYVKEQKIDRFILFDIGLLIALGCISIILDNEVFFKLKPGIISFIMTGLIGYSAYSKHNLLMNMTKRYTRNIEMNPYQLWMMQNSMKRIFWLFLFYSFATFISSFIDNKAIWSFLGGPGLFVVMGIYLAFEWLRRKLQNQNTENEEWLPIVEDNGKIIGSAPRSVVHNKSMFLHPVVHLHVINKDQILLQKRPSHKLVQPNKWDTAVGGHVAHGESIELALQRETQEEIGLTQFQVIPVSQYVWESTIEKELVFVFKTVHKGSFNFDSDEVDDVKFWSFKEINANIGKGIFTPNFEHEFKQFSTSLQRAN